MKARLARLCIAAFAAVLLAAPVRADDKAGDLAIIVNKASKLDTVSSADLARYFKAEKSKTPDGTKIALAMFAPDHPERAAALAGIYHMSEAEFADYFVEATFTGAVSAAPKALNSAAEVKAFVGGNAGGLCYLRASEADDSVKVLKVDGVAPGEAGYKLKIK